MTDEQRSPAARARAETALVRLLHEMGEQAPFLVVLGGLPTRASQWDGRAICRLKPPKSPTNSQTQAITAGAQDALGFYGVAIRHLVPGAFARRLSSVTRVRSVVSASAT